MTNVECQLSLKGKHWNESRDKVIDNTVVWFLSLVCIWKQLKIQNALRRKSKWGPFRDIFLREVQVSEFGLLFQIIYIKLLNWSIWLKWSFSGNFGARKSASRGQCQLLLPTWYPGSTGDTYPFQPLQENSCKF